MTTLINYNSPEQHILKEVFSSVSIDNWTVLLIENYIYERIQTDDEEYMTRYGLKHGLYVHLHPQRQCYFYSEGKRQGFASKWYEDGTLQWCGNFENDEEHGPYTMWYANGQKREQGVAKNGTRIGDIVEWYENGNKKQQFFVLGYYKYYDCHALYDQTYTVWLENGQKQFEQEYKDGKQHGFYKEYYANGQMSEEACWSDNMKNGLTTRWHKNGMKASETMYQDNQRHGTYKEWRECGKFRMECLYKNDRCREMINEAKINEKKT